MGFQAADVEKVYASDINLKRSDVNAVFEWLKRQPHLPELTELQVVLFLHSCYYSIETVKRTIDNYFTVRTNHPQIFECASEDVIRRTLSVANITMLPKKTEDDCVVLSMNLVDTKPENHISIEHMKVGSMILSLYFHQYGPVNGLIIVLDTKGATLGHIVRTNVIALKHLLYFVQEAMPTRIQGIHIINVMSITDKLISLVKPFLKKEISDLIKIHSSLASFHEYVPKECLPVDYEGYLPSTRILGEKNIENLFKNIDFFRWHDSQKVDETKRISKSTNGNYNMEGSFKRLEID